MCLIELIVGFKLRNIGGRGPDLKAIKKSKYYNNTWKQISDQKQPSFFLSFPGHIIISKQSYLIRRFLSG